MDTPMIIISITVVVGLVLALWFLTAVFLLTAYKDRDFRLVAGTAGIIVGILASGVTVAAIIQAVSMI